MCQQAKLRVKGGKNLFWLYILTQLTHLKYKHMSASRYWTNQYGVQDLVIFLTLS